MIYIIQAMAGHFRTFSKKVIVVILFLLSLSVKAEVYYVATTGNNGNAGTIGSPWLTWTYAFTQATAGDTVYFRGGTYATTAGAGGENGFNSGTSGAWIYFLAYPGETPVLDCGAKDIAAYAYNRGITVWNVEYLYFKGLEVKNLYQSTAANDVNCNGIDLYQSGNITLEQIVVHHVAGQAVTINNYYGTIRVINCDSYNMNDSLRLPIYPAPGSAGQNGDGWSFDTDADITGARESRLYFTGCRAWNYSDNGIAGTSVGYVEIDRCWVFSGGELSGEGCGFKYASLDTNERNRLDTARIIKNCIATMNGAYGFSTNNSSDSTMGVFCYNNFSYHNGYRGTDHGVTGGWILNTYTGLVPEDLELYANNLSYDNEAYEIRTYQEQEYTFSHNSWDAHPTVTITDDDFVSLDTLELLRDRQSDGSLPIISFGRLRPTSDLLDVCVDVGLSYYGTAPDMGYSEWTPGPQIIADHTIVDDYINIPQYYIDSVKKMWLVVAGESHSAAYRQGLVDLEAADATFQVNVTTSGTPEAYTDTRLRTSRGTWGDFSNATGWIYTYGEEDWWTNPTAIARTKAGITYSNTNNLTISALALGWCWDGLGNYTSSTYDAVYDTRWWGVSLETTEGGTHGWGLDAADYAITGNAVSLDNYLSATQSYIDYCADSIRTKIFFTTGPMDGMNSEDEYQNSLKYTRIREYVLLDSSRILFDYADILHFDNNGDSTLGTYTYETVEHYYQLATPTNLGDESIGHIDEVGSLRLAKAQWWMLARMAGWDGGVSVYAVVEGGETPPATSVTILKSGNKWMISKTGNLLKQ